MCGIVGYVGINQAAAILIDGLKKLEYRGYDSAGVVVLNGGQVEVRRSVGKIADLEERANPLALEGSTGIGHTRWATHGRPCDENAHPHTDCSGRFAVVHNGIIENHASLRAWLMERGHTFTSETDTEVVPHLLEEFYQGNLEDAFRRVLKHLEGSFALGVLCQDEPEKLLAARKDSPLVVGLGEGENFIASDIPAILNHTRETLIMEDGEMAILTRKGVEVTDFTGMPVEKSKFHVQWDPVQAEKAGYDHFMLKEIFEQPKALRDTMGARLTDDGIKLEEVNLAPAQIQALEKIFIVACGTAFHAGLVGRYALEELTGIPVEVDIASEFRYRNPLMPENSLVIIISQSGETADTLAALRESKKRGARIVAVTNVVGSSVAREAHDVIYTWAGPEIAVASTKAYLTQLVALNILALHLGLQKGTVPWEEAKELVEKLQDLPDQVQHLLDQAGTVKELARKYAVHDNAFFIGRSLDQAVAMEGALKLKEISYIHAEAYAAGELKHGTLALVTEGVPVLALATQPHIFEKMLSNIQEVRARDAAVIALAEEGHPELQALAQHIIPIPATHRLLTPVLAVVPLQLFAYYAAVQRNCDVDKPRNLAKSVTVE